MQKISIKETFTFIKRKASAIDFMTLLKYPRRLLVVETDGFSLRTAVMRGADGQIIVERVAESGKADFAAALAETVYAIKRFTKNLPRHVILLTHDAVPALLRLPVDPSQSGSSERFHEMIRWELEPFLAQQFTVRPLGTIMAGRGYLSHKQVQEILKELNDRKRIAQKGEVERRQPLRFGETAAALGFITRDELHECLTLQEGFRPGNEDSVCGWSRLRSKKDNSEHGIPFLACGIGRNARDRYAKIFHDHGFKLKGIYPSLGCCAAAVGQSSLNGISGVLDIQTGLICSIRLSEGTIHDMRFYPLGGESLSAGAALELLDENVDRIWLCAREHLLQQIQPEIEARFKGEIKCLPVILAAHNNLPPGIKTSLSNMAGAARNAFGMFGEELAVRIPAADPAPPLLQRSRIRRAAAVCAGIAVIGGLEAYLSMEMKKAAAVQSELRMQVKRVEEEVNRVNYVAKKKEETAKSLEKRKLELKNLEERLSFFDDVLSRRTQFVTALLNGVALAATSSGVVIDKISETGNQAVEINGWTVSETAAQQFAKKLASSMRPWQRTVSDLNVWINTGRLGMQGYAVSLILLPKQESPDENVQKKGGGAQKAEKGGK